MMRRWWALVPVGLLVLILAEIAVFVAVVHAIGALWALLALAVSSLLGMVLLRREGIRGYRAFRAAAESRRPAGAQVTTSLIGLVGGLLLALPGFISAVLGLLLLTPPVRVLVRRGVERATERRISPAAAGDLFGPRRVRVRRGDPVPPEPGAQPAPQPDPRTQPAAAIEGDVVEGEIVR